MSKDNVIKNNILKYYFRNNFATISFEKTDPLCKNSRFKNK